MQSRTRITPATCGTDVARSDMSWGLTPKTGPKRSAVERNLPQVCVPICGRDLRRCREAGLPGRPQARIAVALLDELVMRSDLDQTA